MKIFISNIQIRPLLEAIINPWRMCSHLYQLVLILCFLRLYRACFSEPRKGLKRILKKSPGNNATSSAASPEKDSGFESSMSNKNSSPPQRQSFRPVNLPRIYSPSASPSAGILKRRRVTMDESPVNSPSPPNKVTIGQDFRAPSGSISCFFSPLYFPSNYIINVFNFLEP